MPIPENDPDVFAAFLQMHHAIVSGTEGTGSSTGNAVGATADTPSAPSLSKGWQQEIGISDADFAQIEPTFVTLKGQLASLKAETASYVAAHLGNAELSALESFRQREITLLNNSKSSLTSRLSPAGAAALFSFIDGRFRAALTRRPVGNSK